MIKLGFLLGMWDQFDKSMNVIHYTNGLKRKTL